MGKPDIRITRRTVEAIQTIVEEFIVKEFQQAVFAQLHAHRGTLMIQDMHLVQNQRHVREGFYICYNESTRATRAKRALQEQKAERKQTGSKETSLQTGG